MVLLAGLTRDSVVYKTQSPFLGSQAEQGREMGNQEKTTVTDAIRGRNLGSRGQGSGVRSGARGSLRAMLPETMDV